jgi:hypothetical protein
MKFCKVPTTLPPIPRTGASLVTSKKRIEWLSAVRMAPLLLTLLAAACHTPQPSIEFTKIPAAAPGTSFKLDAIAGKVIGGKPRHQIVLYAKSGVWWVQPMTDKPFTTIHPDLTWQNSTHPGTEYGALLIDPRVDPPYVPPPTAQELPHPGGAILAVASVRGTMSPISPTPPKILQFSGYSWEVRNLPGDRGGASNPYDSSNAWTDDHGFLHLRTAQRAGVWTCAEVRLTYSLGRGLYLFTVGDISHLDPATVVTLLNGDDLTISQHHREVAVELSRWGDPALKNAQYVVQPDFVPDNVVRYEAPAGPLVYSFRWEPGRVAFQTFRGRSVLTAHEFTSGIPSPGGELVKINLYAFHNARIPVRSASEVIIEKFEFLP